MKTIEIYGDNYFGHHSITRTACRAIIIIDDMILMSYEKNTGQYMFPGGGLEDNETITQCVKREVEEETGYLIDADVCVLEIDEYYQDEKYINKYCFGKIVGQGKIKLTTREKSVGMEPKWITIDEAISIFSNHESYRNVDEMRRGMYYREYTALKYLKL